MQATRTSRCIRKLAFGTLSIIPGIRTRPKSYMLAINYEQSLAEMMAASQYVYTRPNITEENFPVVEGVAEVEAVLFHLNRIATDEEVLAEIERHGLRPATLPELLAFSAQHPDRQRGFPIVALGSIWTHEHGRDVVYLLEAAGCRGLGIFWLDRPWAARDRFLAIRK